MSHKDYLFQFGQNSSLSCGGLKQFLTSVDMILFFRSFELTNLDAHGKYYFRTPGLP